MLCSLCQHGATSKVGGTPTGATWDCPCGETNCQHIKRCSACGLRQQKQPKQGDYLGLGGELHTTIDHAHRYENGAWLVEDNTGEDFRVVRDPDNDNGIRQAWKLA